MWFDFFLNLFIPYPRNIQYKLINKDASNCRKTGIAIAINTKITIHETVEEESVQRAVRVCAFGGCA